MRTGPKSLSQAWLLGALHNEWKKMKGYNKLEPKRNEGQLQSSLKEFFQVRKIKAFDILFFMLLYIMETHRKTLLHLLKERAYKHGQFFIIW